MEAEVGQFIEDLPITGAEVTGIAAGPWEKMRFTPSFLMPLMELGVVPQHCIHVVRLGWCFFPFNTRGSHFTDTPGKPMSEC